MAISAVKIILAKLGEYTFEESNHLIPCENEWIKFCFIILGLTVKILVSQGKRCKYNYECNFFFF